MFYTTLPKPISHMQQLYKDQTARDKQLANFLLIGSYALQKAEELGLLGDSPDDLEKGRKGMPIGAKAVWGGIEYLKTATGWKPVGKHRGHVKANHDMIHKNEEQDKDHHTMVLDAGKMDHAEWTKKHGSNLHGKYKEVHDYLHKPKAEKPAEKKEEIKVDREQAKEDVKTMDVSQWKTKYPSLSDDYLFFKNLVSPKDYPKKEKEIKPTPAKNEAGFNAGEDHGIEVGKEYEHEGYGKVKVTRVEKNNGDKKDRISHAIHFETKSGSKEVQGINGFRHGTTGDYNGKPKAVEAKLSKLSHAEVIKLKEASNADKNKSVFSDKEITEEMKSRNLSVTNVKKEKTDTEAKFKLKSADGKKEFDLRKPAYHKDFEDAISLDHKKIAEKHGELEKTAATAEQKRWHGAEKIAHNKKIKEKAYVPEKTVEADDEDDNEADKPEVKKTEKQFGKDSANYVSPSSINKEAELSEYKENPARFVTKLQDQIDYAVSEGDTKADVLSAYQDVLSGMSEDDANEVESYSADLDYHLTNQANLLYQESVKSYDRADKGMKEYIAKMTKQTLDGGKFKNDTDKEMAAKELMKYISSKRVNFKESNDPF